METLISIIFGNGDVVFKFTRDWLIQLMECTERLIAGCDIANNNSETIDIKNLCK